ncbi:MAG: ABC transporter permease [Methanothrix sp.]|nr:ABC transporter permease [Methanothrix sp.]
MFELDIARRHVATNRRGTAFTMISVAIAVGIIIMSLGLTEGVRVQILENTIEKNPHLIINPKKTESYINMYRTLSEMIADYPGVLAVSPRLVGQGAARFQDRVQGVEFVGVHPFEENQLMAVQESMISGNFSDLIFSKKGAFLGVKLAQSLKIRQGGDFYLYFKNNSVRLKVIGLLEKGTFKDETLVYIPLNTAQELIGQGDVVSEIGVKLADFTNAPAMALEMNGKSPYKTTSWQDFSKEIARFVGNQNVTNMLFYIFILLISAFVIANTTIMVVSRRKKEIGILMAMGADRSSILKIFLLENMLISLPAGALGCLLGFGLAKLISLLPLDVTSTGGGNGELLIVARPEYFVYAMIFALVLNLISGIYPAYAAARLDPVEAIASE